MSETPQSVLEQWLEFDEPGLVAAKLRVAIRAVLAENKRRCHNVRGEDGPCDCAGCRDTGALLAERDALKLELEKLRGEK